TASATGLCAGSYTVSVTDAAGCVDTATVVVTEPGLLGISTSFTAVSCNGGSDGTASSTPSGGASPYQYSWTDGQLTSTATGLIAGTYTVTVTDNNTCTNTATLTVTEPLGMGPSMSTVDQNCGASDGSATVTLSGGTAPFTYLWSNGQTGSSDTALLAGVYTVTITDGSGCTDSLSAVVNGLGGPGLTTSSTDVSCNGTSDGSGTATASGGVAPYTYIWDDPGSQTTSSAGGLGGGTFNVSVSDTSGCIVIGTVTIIEPPPIVLNLSSTAASCGISDGAATVLAAGGTGSYSYLWSPAGGTANPAVGLAGGIYTVVVTDSSGCTATDSVTVSNTGGPVAAISGTTDASCFSVNDGTATVTVVGGSLPLSYSWSPSGGTDTTGTGLGPGTYVVTITDAGGCISTATALVSSPPDILLNLASSDMSCAGVMDGSVIVVAAGGTGAFTYLWAPSGDTTTISSNLGAGTYSVIVTDANGCSSSDTVSVAEPLSMILNFDSIPATCGASDGAAIVAVTGGTGPYSYSWSPSGSTSDTASGVSVGVYTVTVTDSKSCFIVDSVIVNNAGGQTAALLMSSNVTCGGGVNGSAEVSVTGGTTPYVYAWSTSPSQTNAIATGLSAGSYNCTVTDAALCIAIVPVTITEPLPIVVTIDPDSTVCPNSSFNFSAYATGGTQPYVFGWNNNLIVGANQTVIITQDTSFTVNVSDANFCSGNSATINIMVGPPLDVIAFGTATICMNDSTPISAIGSGGSQPYTLSWDNGAGTGSPVVVGPLGSTTFHVTITDACSATDEDSIRITITPDLILQPLFAFLCPGVTDTLYATGAENYWWIDEITLDTLSTDSFIIITPDSSFNYIIYATDSNDCPNQDTVTVTVYNTISADFMADPEVTTIFEPTIQFTDLSLGDPITWMWDFGDTSTSNIQHPSHTYSDTGYYLVELVVTDDHNCPDSIYLNVRVKEVYSLFAPNTFTPDGDGINDYFFPVGIGVQDQGFEFYIFDRWGDLIYKSTGTFGDYVTNTPLIGWNGKANYGDEVAQEDVYIWLVQALDADLGVHQYIGHITLLK
ncbi:MAG: gliding motility-associated C-terminal domain-containing protein, partial [Flavobacteriales bacterium]|nr:gliding motility-associated C-terminal domain-containing protein [Flavobacteriales bacterium]